MSVSALEEAGQSLLGVLVDEKLIHFWPSDNVDGWTLRSRLWSPFYVDLRGLCGLRGSKQVLENVGDAFAALIADQVPKTTRLVAVATAGIPIATAITMRTNIPTCYTRRERKQAAIDGATYLYGKERFLDGEVLDGDELLLVDDLITDGTSKIEALESVKSEAERLGIRLECRDVAVAMNRGTLGEARLKQHGVQLHSLIPLRAKGLEWLQGRVPDEVIEITRSYLEDPAPFQQEAYRQSLRASLPESILRERALTSVSR